MRRVALLVLALAVSVPVVAGTGAHADSAAEQAAKEIADARERANAAADAYFAAESQVDTLELEVEAIQRQVDELQARVDALTDRVQQIAVNRFTKSSTTASPLLSGFRSPEEQMQLAAFSAVIYDTSAEQLDEFDSLNRDLTAKRKSLAETTRRADREKDVLATLRDQAQAEVERLKKVEAERLKDESIRKALIAEEAARAAKAATDALKAAASTTTVEGYDPAGADGGGGSPQVFAPVAPGVGGQTGGGGAGGRPGGAGGVDYAGEGWVCPTGDYPVAFGDTWGAPRSGGRRHQGVDMIGPIGVPVLAVVDGYSRAWTSELGGFVLSLYGADGHRYFYGHFDSMGFTGPVKAGDQIGTLGQTGNARFSVPHLHFEIHPGGGAAVNPYPTVRAHC
ncbi:MAG: peptidoglycan DD-metalloendopeptidase family protein [Actinomycetota bacterium]